MRVKSHTAIQTAAIIAIAATGLFSLQPTPAAEAVVQMTPVQSAYLEHCGGCHGVQGISAPRSVPSLRGQADQFLCTAKGRAYLIRLPSIALMPVSDQLLADMMNFVVFGLGDPQAARSRTPYTESEVSALRKDPLTGTGLAQYRADVIAELIERCGAPRNLLTGYTDNPLARAP